MKIPLFALAILATGVSACGPSDTSENTAEADVSSRYEIDADKVPVELRSLIPFAERWGIGDDAERSEFIDAASASDREDLRAAVQPQYARITVWLDSFGSDPMSDEAAAFMYMQLAIEEVP
jgi:hypothetical protein